MSFVDETPADILIVDHEDTRRSVYKDWLETAGYRCEEARDGKAGFRATDRKSYQLVVSQLNLPDWDGIDMAAATGLLNPKQKILIVASNGLREYDTQELDTMSNVAGYIDGPVNGEKLVRLVRSCLDSSATG